MSYRQIIIVVKKCIGCNFTIHGYDPKPDNLNVNKVGKICISNEYTPEICHHLSKDRYSYICKNPNNDNYTLKNNINQSNLIDFVNSDCYYVEKNRGGIENNNMKCNSNTCEYFSANSISKINTNMYSYYPFNINDNKFITNSEINMVDYIDKTKMKFTDFLIVIDNSNIKNITDYKICLSTKKLSNDEIQNYINISKNKNYNNRIDLAIKNSDEEIIFGNNYYKLNKCENNVCKKIQKTDYLLYGNPIDKNTLLNVAPLRKLIDNKPYLENTDIDCFNKNMTDKLECYLTPTKILSKQLKCNRVDNNIICTNPNPNINETFTLPTCDSCSNNNNNNKCNTSFNNVFVVLLFSIICYYLFKY